MGPKGKRPRPGIHQRPRGRSIYIVAIYIGRSMYINIVGEVMRIYIVAT